MKKSKIFGNNYENTDSDDDDDNDDVSSFVFSDHDDDGEGENIICRADAPPTRSILEIQLDNNNIIFDWDETNSSSSDEAEDPSMLVFYL